MRALLLAILIASGGCAHAPVVKPAPAPEVHFTSAIFFHTCGIVTAIELVNSDGQVLYLNWYKTDDDVFDAAVQAANSLATSAVMDIEVSPHCMKA